MIVRRRKPKRPTKLSVSVTSAKRISTNHRHPFVSRKVLIVLHITLNEKNEEINISHFATLTIKMM